MTLEQSPLELESSTLEEIVEALSWGRPITLPENADSFLLATDDARIAFRFYASKRELWAAQKQTSGSLPLASAPGRRFILMGRIDGSELTSTHHFAAL